MADAIVDALAERLGVAPAPDCRLGQARLTLTFRRLGASRWPEERQVEYALRAAAIVRELLAGDARRTIQRRATRAIEVVYEDAALVRGCAVTARWECVVTAAADGR